METSAVSASTDSGAAAMVQTETFKYDDAIVRMFSTATVAWALVATLMGLTVALLLVLPSLLGGLVVSEYLTFGRLRPLHTNAAIFAFAGNAIFAAIYYSTQRLCKCRMWSDVLGRLHFWSWQAIIIAAAITLPMGITQGKEYAELEWPIDIAIAVVWLVFFGTNFFMTLHSRRERHLYVSLWFYIATIVTVAILHVFNNLVLPIGWCKSYSLYAGVQDAFMQWWYGHNAIAFFMIMPFLGLMYYFLPKAAGRPVFSYKLSVIHFWSLVFIYIWAGPHHLHYTALPEWASTLGMIFGVMLWMPSWGGMINGLLTLRGAWKKITTDPVLKFFVVGLIFYGLATLEGPLLSIKSINALTHYSDWTIAHVHAGALGWNGFMTFGMLYWLMPRIYQTNLWSSKLANLHFWVGLLGILLYILPIYAAGLRQGFRWSEFDETGRLTYPEFIEIVQSVVPFWWVRVLGGTLFVIGIVMLCMNLLMTWLRRPSTYEELIQVVPRLLSETQISEVIPESRLAGAPVLDFGQKIDIWTQLGWHRRWERLPLRFTAFVLFAVAVGSLFEMLPIFLIRSNIPTVSTVTPYTPLELAGRDIYIAEGCYNCHSQMIRPLVADTARFGEYSKPGESIYDHPFQWGSRRIGPDLAREGGRQSSFWLWRHFENPSKEVKGSVMPEFQHLLLKRLNFSEVEPRVKAAAKLGAAYDLGTMDIETIAKEQAEFVAAEIVRQGGSPEYEGVMVKDSTVVALIAYVQRLGVDLLRTPTPVSVAEKAPVDEAPAVAGDMSIIPATDTPSVSTNNQ